MMKKTHANIKLLCNALIAPVILTSFLVSCNRKPAIETMELTQPECDISYDFGFDMETDYSNITAETEYPSYQKNVERIQINIVNQNPGKAFYLYKKTYLQLWHENGWVTLKTKDEGYTTFMDWGLVGIENYTGPFTTCNFFYPSRLTGAFEAGHYRCVVFVGETQIYAEFDVTD